MEDDELSFWDYIELGIPHETEDDNEDGVDFDDE